MDLFSTEPDFLHFKYIEMLLFLKPVASLIAHWENWIQSMNEKNDKLQFSQFICTETSSHSYLLYLP